MWSLLEDRRSNFDEMKTVTRHKTSYISDVSSLFEKVRDMPDAIWLDSGKPRSLQGNLDIISSAPDTIIETRGSVTSIQSGNDCQSSSKDPFLLVQQLLAPLLPIHERYRDLPFTGGVMGFFGYDLGRRLIDIPTLAASAVDLPDMRVGRYLWALIVDHESKEAEIVFHESCDITLKGEIQRRLISPANQKSDEHDRFNLKSKFTATLKKDEYINAVEMIKNYIVDGDCYQTNFTQHFTAPYSGEEWQAYLTLRNATASPYSVFWKWGRNAILSFSPERFLKVSPGGGTKLVVETKPIKGTAPRGQSPTEDGANASALYNSEKDRAENLMIVDLLRNDISQNCATGTVKVPELFKLESFPNVHHLVSTITGELELDRSPIDLLRDCFPGGSITGAPKKRAMEIIEELEPVKRSVYCGSIGYISSNNRMDTNIAIRTVIASDSVLHCWAGGGIVNDSDANNEYLESLSKIVLILNTLEN